MSKVTLINNEYRCSVCNQFLYENQQKCPICKENLVWDIDRLQLQTFRHTSKPKRAKSVDVGSIVFISLIVILILLYIFPFLQEKEHTDIPIIVTEAYEGGFDYHTTQIFFKTEQSENTEKKIKNVLDSLEYKYENLMYNMGYYSADFTDAPSFTTLKDYEENRKVMEDKVLELMKIQGLYMEINIQGWYKYYQKL